LAHPALDIEIVLHLGSETEKRMATKYLETSSGHFAAMDSEMIEAMPRTELIQWLESRGFACYDEESTELLRECAIEDWRGEAYDY